MNRLETRPGTTGVGSVTWGPWTGAVLLKSVNCTLVTGPAVQHRRLRLTVNLLGAGIIGSYYSSAVPESQACRMTAYAGGTMPEIAQLFAIDPVTGLATYDYLTSEVPLVICLPVDCMLPARATLVLNVIDGVAGDALAALIAEVIDLPS